MMMLGKGVLKLVKGVENMNAISTFNALNPQSPNRPQIDNMRKMLIAMVDDVRVVLIKLAERLCILREAAMLPESIREQIATESMDVYAPLANRLGIGAIKWEMEDLAFRVLKPNEYKKIAKGLNARRLERDSFVECIVAEITDNITKMQKKHFEVYGRSKHIHSIYRKMQRKNVQLDEIYDATAVRILADTEVDCYECLSLVHSLWTPIPAEFDDYISHPKQNGYQSLHTAVSDAENNVFEIQIRTFDMHLLAEMGVAAHWKYKEGAVAEFKESHERKIEWLREVLAWHRETAEQQGISDAIETEFLEDRVYVFTPQGDILDLPQGVTPLDFAYHIHTQIGHRCRGAKVNGMIVPLTYSLQTGDRVEILTTKEEKPSRDWMNSHLNYLKTSRAKAKVLHWFKMQDFHKNQQDGQTILDKELRSYNFKPGQLQEAAEKLHFKTTDDLYAAVGRGEIKPTQIVARVLPTIEAEPLVSLPLPHKHPVGPVYRDDLSIEGVGNLLTHMARCCHPVPGDAVVGYITIGRGVSVHRRDCSNIIYATEKQRSRFLEVEWGNKTKTRYQAKFEIFAYERNGLLRDITTTLSLEKANVISLNTVIDKTKHVVDIQLVVEIDSLESLSRLLSKLQHIPNVYEARRMH